MDRLIKCMLQRFAIDLNNKVLVIRKEYRLHWHPERALAFAVAVEGCINIDPTKYEHNILLKLQNQIIQETTLPNY